jgi:Arc/MetJ family transcription regulator
MMIMRTTIDLPEDLVEEAMKLSHQRTKTGVIIAALEDYVRKIRIQGLKKYRGKIELDLDLATLRKRP